MVTIIWVERVGRMCCRLVGTGGEWAWVLGGTWGFGTWGLEVGSWTHFPVEHVGQWGFPEVGV